jgi:phenylpropionate dioxygenase-like ring-hydroxylating dioxygenase large terminal subunit
MENKEDAAMIRNQWYVVLESTEVGAKPVGVTRLGEKMVFWRDQAGKISAAVDRCPHRGVALSVGKVLEDICSPFHGFNTTRRKMHTDPANGRNGVIPTQCG